MAQSQDHATTSSSADAAAAAAAAAQPTFSADDLPHILSNIVKLRSVLTNFIEPDFGLLDQLLSLQVLTRFQLADVRSERTVYRRSQAFLELITSEDQCGNFLTALQRTGQQHVVNFITQNGDVGVEYGDVRPLDEDRMRTLTINGVQLLDRIESDVTFLGDLAAVDCITLPQKEHLINIGQPRDRNDKLLEFLTRRSVADFKKFTKVLSKYQDYLVPLLVTDGVVVGVHAELDESSVQFEGRIVSQSRQLLPADSESEILDEFNAILSRFSLQTRLVVVERVHSLALYFICMTLAALLSLRDQWSSGQLRDIVQSLFSFLSFAADECRVKRLTWPQNDYERSVEFFRSSQEGEEYMDLPAGITGSGIPTLAHAPMADTAVAAAASMDMGWDFEQELEEMKSAFKSGGVEECRTLLERKRDEWKQIPLNVAVIGSPGVGKSSFINAIRRLTADDERGAPVAVGVQVTYEMWGYSHPSNPLLKFWDLPGIGTDRFPRQNYLSNVEVDRFDFFLLITADRFTENDTWLGEEFHKRKKKYFVVRTKVGVDISNNKKAHPKTHNEDDVLKVIRESTQEHLNERGCRDVPVFLIDSYNLKKFDFELLESRLVEDFPKLKKAALVLSLQSMSKEMIHLKVAELRSRIWKVAALSGVAAAIPVPLLFLAIDIKVVANEAEFYYTQLGLDETSLKRYAELTNTDYQQMKSIVDRCLGLAINVEGIRKLIQPSVPVLTSVAVVEGSRFIPLLGSIIAAPTAFTGTYYALKLVLDKMESVAMEVVEFAAKSATGAEESDDMTSIKTSGCEAETTRTK